MSDLLHDFETCNYDELCEEILNIGQEKDESLEEFSLRFMHQVSIDFVWMIFPLSKNGLYF
jgi:hypothetical protein